MGRQSSASLFLILVLGLFEHLLCVRSENIDICTTATYIGSYKRSTAYILNTIEKPQCDDSIENDGWYSFGNSTGDKMPEICVEVFQCGSKAPIWLNGTHPTAQNPGPIKQKICGRKIKGGPCCEYTDEIQVKWCQSATTKTDYFVYQLKRPPMCELSYCAGSKLKLKCKDNCAWNEVISNCSCPTYPATKPPVLEKPVISSMKNVTDTRGQPFIATRFSLKCTFGYPEQEKDDGARFMAVLQSNGVPIANATKHSHEPFINFDELFLYGRLGTNTVCSGDEINSDTNL